jgi:hypothetical protein
MFTYLRLAIPGVCLALALSTGVRAQHAALSDELYMQQALAAAPEAIAKNASVIRPEHDEAWRTLREGTNGFLLTLFPQPILRGRFCGN